MLAEFQLDNGSLAGRLFDQPELLKSLFAVCHLPAEGNFEAPNLAPAISSLLKGSFSESSAALSGDSHAISTLRSRGNSSGDIQNYSGGDIQNHSDSGIENYSGAVTLPEEVLRDDLQVTVEQVVAATTVINAFEAYRAVLMEKARRQAVELDDLIDTNRPTVAMMSSRAQEQKWLERTAVSTISAAIKMSESTVSRRANVGRELIARAPQSLAAALDGKVSWSNVQVIADTVTALPTDLAIRFDTQVVNAAQHKTPAELKRKAAQLRERLHPTPAVVRHSEAACERHVWTAPGPDGMATLGLYAPAVAVHAIFDRLTTTALQVSSPSVAADPNSNTDFPITNGGNEGSLGGDTYISQKCNVSRETTLSVPSKTDPSKTDPRTMAQLRADTLISLALDDGGLDLLAASHSNPSRYPTNYPTELPTQASTLDPTVDPSVELEGHTAEIPIAVPGVHSGADLSILVEPPELRAGSNGYRGDPDLDNDGRSVFEPWETTGFQLAKLARSIRPNVFITVPAMTILGHADEPALLDGMIPIDPQTAIELTGLAPSLTRILTHPVAGHVLGVDTNTYRPPKEFQDYINTRDTCCRFPGCTRKAANCDIDHTEEFANGGKTNVNNLALLCRAHHTLKTVGTFKLEQTNRSGGRTTMSRNGISEAAIAGGTIPGGALPGTLVWTDPFGRQYRTNPEPIPATGHPNGFQPRPPEEDNRENCSAWDNDFDADPPF